MKKKVIGLECFIFIGIFSSFFGLMIHHMGAVNMMNTMLNTCICTIDRYSAVHYSNRGIDRRDCRFTYGIWCRCLDQQAAVTAYAAAVRAAWSEYCWRFDYLSV